MEFHNVKLLPKGLPEIICEFVPYELYPDTKVIAFRRRRGRGIRGSLHFDHATSSYQIWLYPTVISFYPDCGYGVYSFRLWQSHLRVALHEIGHLATFGQISALGSLAGNYNSTDRYLEKLANEFAVMAMARILSINARLGQPEDALTGYPGILAYQYRNNCGRPWNGEYSRSRIAEWRALKCGGQVTIADIVRKIFSQLYHLDADDFPREDWERDLIRAYLGRAVRKAARDCGIHRYYVNKNGRKYLMFNVGEADTVLHHLQGISRPTSIRRLLNVCDNCKALGKFLPRRPAYGFDPLMPKVRC